MKEAKGDFVDFRSDRLEKSQNGEGGGGSGCFSHWKGKVYTATVYHARLGLVRISMGNADQLSSYAEMQAVSKWHYEHSTVL